MYIYIYNFVIVPTEFRAGDVLKSRKEHRKQIIVKVHVELKLLNGLMQQNRIFYQVCLT